MNIMARMKLMTSINAEIEQITSELEKLEQKQNELTERLLQLQKLKQEYEAKQVMDAFRKSGKSLQELLTFLEV